MLSKKKKIFILSGMLVLLVATGFLNVWLNNREKPVNTTEEKGSFFTTYRADRENSRNQTFLYLNTIINNAASTEQAVAEANAQLSALTLAKEQERVIEGEVKALGFAECVISTSTGYVNVMVQADKMLESEQVAQILYIAMSETGKPATSVRIIPVESNNSL